ncbi:hypothetical protein [Oscillatoria sp. FACHB-1407]
MALGLAYLVMSLNASTRPSMSDQQRSLLAIQAVLAPIVFFPVGLVFIFQGWRLDPILQFSLWWLHFLIIFLGIKDFLVIQNR